MANGVPGGDGKRKRTAGTSGASRASYRPGRPATAESLSGQAELACEPTSGEEEVTVTGGRLLDSPRLVSQSGESS
ncbi:hypothetical protein LY76DRAFT_590700 [Colletotrichum caudatum]|nr:hypothetical protein LY76DRAFT_590700 [Colletotrichum caudatum]